MFKFKRAGGIPCIGPVCCGGGGAFAENASAEASCQYRECTCRRAAGSPCAGRKRPGTRGVQTLFEVSSKGGWMLR